MRKRSLEEQAAELAHAFCRGDLSEETLNEKLRLLREKGAQRRTKRDPIKAAQTMQPPLTDPRLRWVRRYGVRKQSDRRG
jgi:hypothetical protein